MKRETKGIEGKARSYGLKNEINEKQRDVQRIKDDRDDKN